MFGHLRRDGIGGWREGRVTAGITGRDVLMLGLEDGDLCAEELQNVVQGILFGLLAGAGELRDDHGGQDDEDKADDDDFDCSESVPRPCRAEPSPADRGKLGRLANQGFLLTPKTSTK